MSAAQNQPGRERGPDDGRRKLCQAALGGMTLVAVGTVGYPIVSFLKLPKSMRPKKIMTVALAELAEGAAVWGEHEGRQVVVVKLEGEVRVFDGACTHLGCIVQWDVTERMFKCPCHGAVFDGQGKPVRGPVNVPLHTVKYTVSDGVLKVG